MNPTLPPDDTGRNGDPTRTMVAVLICILFYVGYTEYLKRKYPDYMKPPVPAAATTSPETGPAASQVPQTITYPEQATAAQKTATEIKPLPVEELTFDSELATITLNQKLSAVQSVKLKKYFDRIGDGAKAVEVLDTPLQVQGFVGSEEGTPALAGVFSARRDGKSVIFSRQEGTWLVEQIFTPGDSGYEVDANVRFTNTSGGPLALVGNVLITQSIDTRVASSGSILPGSPSEKPRIVTNIRDSDEFVPVETFCEDKGADSLKANNSEVRFFGFDRHYFVNAFVPAKTKTTFKSWKPAAVPGTPDHMCPVTLAVYENLGTVNAGQSAEISLRGFIGPKIPGLLKQESVYLTDTLDMGWFDVLAQPLLLAIKGFEGVLKNYGLAIILLTVLLKVLFYPLTKKAAESAHKMKKFNPEMQRIRERYKDDPRTQQQEIMRFMAAHKLNPMQGCLPILPQIPVFLAFYRVLSSAIELRHAPFFGWILDLSAADPYYITPLLLGAGMFVQQKLTPMTGMDETQQKVMLAMPVIFTVMMLTLPAGMVLYMLTNTVMSIAQQQWLNNKLNDAPG